MASAESVRIPPETMHTVFHRILIRHGFTEKKAAICSEIFTTNSLEGVYTHGVNRFPRFVEYVKKGHVKPDKEAICKNSSSAIEQWDGQEGPGPINALVCTDRVAELASQFGIGCVTLSNTNHWMRGGTYGWKAARKGYAFIGWTNTLANMPAWGAVDSKLGNNPLVIAVPYENDAIVLDMAMSQYSYGSMELKALKKEKLPVQGGYDLDGNLTDDPEKILQSRRTLPVGYWKGAGLSLLLDVLAAALSGGLSTAQVSKLPAESNLSQVFIAIDISKLNHYKSIGTTIRAIIDDYHQSTAVNGKEKIRYPGERVLLTREENSQGIPVLKKVWDEIQAL